MVSKLEASIVSNRRNFIYLLCPGPWSFVGKKRNSPCCVRRITEMLYRVIGGVTNSKDFGFQPCDSSLLLKISEKRLGWDAAGAHCWAVLWYIVVVAVIAYTTCCQKLAWEPGPLCPWHSDKKTVPVPKLTSWIIRQQKINWGSLGQREKCCA